MSRLWIVRGFRPWSLLTVLIAVVAPGGASAQDTIAPSTTPYVIEWHTAPMVRTAGLVDLSSRLIDRGANWSVDQIFGDLFQSPTKKGFGARLTKYVVFDTFIIAYVHVVAHEYGHAARLSEADLHYDVVIAGTPWNLGETFTRGQPSPDPVVEMGIYGGGFDATWTLFERIQDRLHTADAAAPGDLAALLMHVIGAVAYQRNDLADWANPDWNGNFEEVSPGDPKGYLLELIAKRGEEPSAETLGERARSVRRDALLSLADFDLVSIGVGLFRDYLWRGERAIAMRRLVWGNYSFSPHMRFNLTPVGPEYQVGSHVRWSDNVVRGYFRWAEDPIGQHSFGIGTRYVRLTEGSVRPAATIDLWRNPEGGLGARVEATATFSPGRNTRWVIQASIGGKTRGYVLGMPIESGLHAGIGGGARF